MMLMMLPDHDRPDPPSAGSIIAAFGSTSINLTSPHLTSLTSPPVSLPYQCPH